MNVAGIILAAGDSTRMGKENKLALPWNGKPMLAHVIKAALHSKLSQTCVVLGHQSQLIKGMINHLKILWVENNHWKTGMASSIVAGVKRMEKYDGYLILLGDMPLINSQMINDIIFHGTMNNIVIPVHQGKQGNPVFFGSFFRNDLLSISGDQGAKKIIQQYADSVVKIDIQSDAIFQDIDTKANIMEYLGIA